MNDHHAPKRLKVYQDHHDRFEAVLIPEDAESGPAVFVASDIGPINCHANARRLVACWNVCDGIETGDLEVVDELTVDELTRLRAVNAGLLAACEKALAAYDDAHESGHGAWSGRDVDEMRTAVEKAKEGSEA